MLRTCRDAAYPPPGWPLTEVTLVYAGGDTPNPWTGPGVPPYVGGSRFVVPAWVRSNPAQVAWDADAHAFLAWLTARTVPAGALVMLDLETAIAPAYVNGFGASLHSAGYKVAPYGSTSSLFQNPQLDGYWPASYTGQPHLYNHAGVIATQWGSYGSYDLSSIADGIVLWDLASPSQPPVRIPKERRMFVAETSDEAHPRAFLVREARVDYLTVAADLDHWLAACGQTAMEPLTVQSLRDIGANV